MAFQAQQLPLMGSFLTRNVGGWVEHLGFGARAIWVWIWPHPLFAAPALSPPDLGFLTCATRIIRESSSPGLCRFEMRGCTMTSIGRKLSARCHGAPSKEQVTKFNGQSPGAASHRRKPGAWHVLGRGSKDLSSEHQPMRRESDFITPEL